MHAAWDTTWRPAVPELASYSSADLSQSLSFKAMSLNLFSFVRVATATVLQFLQ